MDYGGHGRHSFYGRSIELAADGGECDLTFGKTKYVLTSPYVHFNKADRPCLARQPHRASVKHKIWRNITFSFAAL
jgi:hypothetical protein